jgi:HK97 family phage portal protein
MNLLSRIFGADTQTSARVEPPLMASEEQTTGTAKPESWIREFGWGPQSRVKSLPRVSALIAQKHATVTACCSVLAGDISKVPLLLKRRKADGEEEVIRDHPLAYLMNVESSDGVPASVLRFTLAYAFTLRGNAFAYAPRDGSGELTMVDLIKQDRPTILRNGRQRFYDFEDGARIHRRVASRSMAHLRYMSEDGWMGRSPIEVAAETMGLALAHQEAAARTASGITLKAKAVLKEEFEDDESRRRRAEGIKQALVSGSDTTGVAILSEGEELESLDLSASDQQLLESQKFDVGQIRSLYRVPAFKLQDAEHGVKANSEQGAIDYRTDALLHWGGFIETGLALALLTRGERESGFFLEHDFTALMRPTIKDQYDAMAKAVGGPFMTANHAQKRLGLPITNGPDDNKLNPAPNMTRDKEKSGEKETEE